MKIQTVKFPIGVSVQVSPGNVTIATEDALPVCKPESGPSIHWSRVEKDDFFQESPVKAALKERVCLFAIEDGKLHQITIGGIPLPSLILAHRSLYRLHHTTTNFKIHADLLRFHLLRTHLDRRKRLVIDERVKSVGFFTQFPVGVTIEYKPGKTYIVSPSLPQFYEREGVLCPTKPTERDNGLQLPEKVEGGWRFKVIDADACAVRIANIGLIELLNDTRIASEVALLDERTFMVSQDFLIANRVRVKNLALSKKDSTRWILISSLLAGIAGGIIGSFLFNKTIR